MIDACCRYQKTRYVEVGDEGKDNFGVYLEAIDNDGNIVKGVTVTIGMAKAEGWYGRNEKWKNLTSLMLRYRAAAFFMRTECASIAMGFLTKEEVEAKVEEFKKHIRETNHYDRCCICEKNGWKIDGKRPECYYNDGTLGDRCWEQEIFEDDSYFYITEEEFYD